MNERGFRLWLTRALKLFAEFYLLSEAFDFLMNKDDSRQTGKQHEMD